MNTSKPPARAGSSRSPRKGALVGLAVMALLPAQNLVKNPGFETGGARCEAWDFGNWGTAGQAAWAEKDGLDGGRGVMIACPDDKARASASQFVKVDGGKTYRLRLSYRGEKVDEGKALARLTFVGETSDKTGPEKR